MGRRGGTILDAECAESSTWDNNLFWGAGLRPEVATSAFEYKGRGRTAAPAYIRNNTILYQPFEGIDLASTENIIVSGNLLADVNRGWATGAIKVRNVATWRSSRYIQITSNTITKGTSGVPSMASSGVEVGGCQPFNGASDCGLAIISNISVSGNTFIGLPVGVCRIDPISLLQDPWMGPLPLCP